MAQRAGGMIGRFLRFAARHGRACLVLGLVAGFALPDLAQALKPALPPMVAALVFLSALRIGARAAIGNLAEARGNLGLVLALQGAVPLVLVAAFLPLGPAAGTVGLALVLAMSAPSISGGPAFTAMLGHDPAPAMRMLILGTALLPLTVLPVFWLLPALGGPGGVVQAALRLTLVIGVATTAAFTLRRLTFPNPGPETIRALDGAAAIALAVIVIALMSAVGPALRTDPAVLAGWLALAFGINFGMQALSFGLHRATGRMANAVPVSVIAGNRNIALFLVALPAQVTDPVLIFIGCYQVPMYLTPVLLRRFYRAAPENG